ncbi:plasmid stabilization system protein [mine drainage metagenome]|uniref:Plasmid stabilization system protein n=1 Tax=mine drainage metagenome TaxID=410659 RepID=A0A1J5PHU9_9ZZZZ
MKSIIVPLALAELREATAFYADRAGVELGLAFVAEFERVVKIIHKNPLAGTAVRVNRLAYPFRRFPYSVMYYLAQDDELRIIAITHQRRRPNYWAKRS